MCGTGGNVCALSDGIGTGEVAHTPPYNYWVGKQDWCTDYEGTGVTSAGGWVDSTMYVGSGTYRIVQTSAYNNSGPSMFTGDCTGTSGVIGYQDLQI